MCLTPEKIMRVLATVAAAIVIGGATVSVANAACTGGFSSGWASGAGTAQFTMSEADGSCQTGFPRFTSNTLATRVTFTRAPKSGKASLTSSGVVYTPAKGFKGKDSFCTRNTSPQVRGTLSGCITVTVR